MSSGSEKLLMNKRHKHKILFISYFFKKMSLKSDDLQMLLCEVSDGFNGSGYQHKLL